VRRPTVMGATLDVRQPKPSLGAHVQGATSAIRR
jgi:hypothetical protein